MDTVFDYKPSFHELIFDGNGVLAPEADPQALPRRSHASPLIHTGLQPGDPQCRE